MKFFMKKLGHYTEPYDKQRPVQTTCPMHAEPYLTVHYLLPRSMPSECPVPYSFEKLKI